MIKYLRIISVLIFLLNVNVLSAQKLDKINFVHFDPVVCYASGLVEKSSIPPPEVYLKRLKSGNEKTAHIIVDYINFSEEAKTSFQAAVEIWEYLIDSDIPIYVQAIWSSGLGDNTLGSCGSTRYGENFDGAFLKDTYYPIALVEKLMGEELTGIYQPDMVATFNSNINWYYGIDGKTPRTQYDLISTVLHEIGHGLGFIGFMYHDGTLGGYDGFGDKHACAFDQYIINGSKQNLTDKGIFQNPSITLGSQLVSNGLRYDSPIFKYVADESKPKLYAPSKWNEGSSIYHLNDATYPNGNENSLMTHSAGMGESILDPGPLVLDMLADIGWKTVFITHTNAKDVETTYENRKIEAEITSDFPLDSSTVYLHYAVNNATIFNSVALIHNKNTGKFEGLIPIDPQTETVDYYFSAADIKFRTFTKPSNAPEETFQFSVGPDTIGPVIEHTPVSYIIIHENTELKAFADDNIGVDTIYVEHTLNGVAQPTFGLTKQTATSYTGTFEFSGQLPVDGDIIKYRMVAIDSAVAKNTSILPESGYFTTSVETVLDPVTKFYTNISADLNEFVGHEFNIGSESGFDSDALHSPHPYAEALDFGEINYSTVLRYPIIVADGGDISFDEVVLVEPGELQSSYGTYDFWDFVIVEGSKDNGNNWKPLADGYDSRKNLKWFVAYKENTVGNNSTTQGTKDLFFHHTVSLTENGNFAEGDTILIRFRLYSDQLSSGWGWAIDNIRIQIPTANDFVPAQLATNTYLYPNPFTDEIYISILSKKGLSKVTTNIYNSFGQLVKSITSKTSGNNYSDKLQVSELTTGMYVVKIIADEEIIETRKMIKK